MQLDYSWNHAKKTKWWTRCVVGGRQRSPSAHYEKGSTDQNSENAAPIRCRLSLGRKIKSGGATFAVARSAFGCIFDFTLATWAGWLQKRGKNGWNKSYSAQEFCFFGKRLEFFSFCWSNNYRFAHGRRPGRQSGAGCEWLVENAAFSGFQKLFRDKSRLVHKVNNKGPRVRNYFKILAIKYRNHGEPGPVNGDMFAFGANHDQLMYHVNAANEMLKILEPAFTWTFTYPTDPVETYWMLNALNFGRILNGGASADNAQFFWNNTRLNLTSSEQVYFDQTQTKEQGSPRSTFPTSLGTDGQRLKSGRPSNVGSALNYLGKLFFLTSNNAFKSLWDSLDQGKITATEALTLANAIVKAGWMAARAYIVDIVGGTASATIQIQGTQTLKSCVFSAANVAAGKYELSLSSTSQIGTAQPDSNVLARMNVSAGGATGPTTVGAFELNQPVKAFQSIYVHCTGAGNLGNAVIRWAERVSYFALGAGVGGGSNSWVVDHDCTFRGAVSMNKDTTVLITNGLNFPGLPATNTPISFDQKYMFAIGAFARGWPGEIKIPLRRGDTLYLYFSAEGAVIMYFDDFIAE
jgi:hypothetical protein